jgi:hypothetical protein
LVVGVIGAIIYFKKKSWTFQLGFNMV